METEKKLENVAIGNRLREARHNMNLNNVELAKALNVTEDHYRKLEAGVNGLTLDKLLILHDKYGIDPTYLLTGKGSFEKNFDFDYYIANISTDAKEQYFHRVFAYLENMMKK